MGLKKGRYCIDVIVQWSSRDQCETVAKEFLDELKSMIAQVCDERSPGVIVNWFYLDSSHLQQLSEDAAIYSSREVDQKSLATVLMTESFLRDRKEIFFVVSKTW